MFISLFTFGCLWMGVTSDLISRGKPTVYSSAWDSSWGGSQAVDGNYDNNAYKGSCFHSKSEAIPFIIIDLEGTFAIDHVVIYNRFDGYGERIIGSVVELLSRSGQLLYECGKLTKSFAVYDIPCGNRVAQKVRVRGPRDNNLQICELEVHGDPVVTLISRGKLTSESSAYDEMFGSFAVDGIYKNYVNKDGVYDIKNCFLSNQDEMPFMVIDLNGTFAIDHIVMFNREDCCSERMVGAVVELLFQNGQMSHECAKITETMNVYNISCGNNFAQKIRIVGATNEYLQLCEVDVYGKPQSLQQIISRKKPTIQSSMYASLDSSLAVDGLYNNYIDRQGVVNWRTCFHSEDDKDPFMEVDLQGKFTVDFVVLYNRMDCCSQRIIGTVIELVAKNGSVYYQCGKITETKATYNISCGHKIGYKVRVSAKPYEFLQICELDVFGGPPISIISKGKPTKSSKVYEDLESSYAVDGLYDHDFTDENVKLFHTQNDEEPFWEVDLQGKFIIDSVFIYNRIDCCSERMIDVSILLLTETGEVGYQCGKITDTKAAYKVPCGNNVAYKVRINGTANQYMHFSEVDVFGDIAEL